MSLVGKTALVTGAGRGIGLGCAIELARAGASVIINDRPGSPDLADAVSQVAAHGTSCSAIEQNVHTREGCEALVAEALHLAKRIDILVSNPAVSVRNPFLDFDPKDFDAVIAGTLTAQFHMGQLVARQMVAHRRDPHDGCQGKIVFISSVHGEMPYGKSVAYNAAKAGLNHMALTMAAELSCERINVNVIEPGWIDTPGERKHFGVDMMRAVAPTLPWGRLGTPHDIGAAATFLSSDAADYITGSILRVDGGFVLKDCRGDSVRRP